ncbi:unnamed protein product [Ilex paraguariensis]|uniref:Uncharacterized protein n=1 Tax=Ilex paraguariensis TaxID=185542 RepID=A0ABC8RJF3_9AQUA
MIEIEPDQVFEQTQTKIFTEQNSQKVSFVEPVGVALSSSSLVSQLELSQKPDGAKFFGFAQQNSQKVSFVEPVGVALSSSSLQNSQKVSFVEPVGVALSSSSLIQKRCLPRKTLQDKLRRRAILSILLTSFVV